MAGGAFWLPDPSYERATWPLGSCDDRLLARSLGHSVSAEHRVKFVSGPEEYIMGFKKILVLVASGTFHFGSELLCYCSVSRKYGNLCRLSSESLSSGWAAHSRMMPVNLRLGLHWNTRGSCFLQLVDHPSTCSAAIRCQDRTHLNADHVSYNSSITQVLTARLSDAMTEHI